MSGLEKERKVAIDAVSKAYQVCKNVFKQLAEGQTISKSDESPVTVADFSAQAVVNTVIHRSFPNDPIAGEEDSEELRGGNSKGLREKILSLVNSELKDEPLDEEKLLEAIDRGNYSGGPQGRMWVLDPVDGTKGFLRGEQFAVCLALVIDGEVQLGVMGCPNLPVDFKNPEGEKGCLFVAEKGQGAFQRNFSSTEETQIHVADISSISKVSFCESVEPSHSSCDINEQIARHVGITKEPIRMDSQCKYVSVCRGHADIYLRLSPRANFKEKIWDHAAGTILAQEAGCIVSDIYGKPLNFSIGRTLKANKGIIVAHPEIHPQIVEAAFKVLHPIKYFFLKPMNFLKQGFQPSYKKDKKQRV